MVLAYLGGVQIRSESCRPHLKSFGNVTQDGGGVEKLKTEFHIFAKEGEIKFSLNNSMSFVLYLNENCGIKCTC